MKRIIVFILFISIFITGCGKTVGFTGESENWQGQYNGVITDDTIAGEFIFRYKNAPTDVVIEDLEITLDDGDMELVEEEHLGATVISSSTCSWCTSSQPIKVVIKWGSENEETFFIEPN